MKCGSNENAKTIGLKGAVRQKNTGNKHKQADSRERASAEQGTARESKG